MTTTATLIHPAHLARVLSRAGLYHLSANSLQVLCELAASGADSQPLGQLARKLEITSTAITGIADKLDAAGFTQRVPSRTDRRTIWLNLTDRGRAALQDILDA